MVGEEQGRPDRHEASGRMLTTARTETRPKERSEPRTHGGIEIQSSKDQDGVLTSWQRRCWWYRERRTTLGWDGVDRMEVEVDGWEVSAIEDQ
jgi:hypothetical protein